MSTPRLKRPTYTDVYTPLGKLADELHLPIKTVLYLAAKGYLPLFAMVKQKDVLYVSVHENLFKDGDAELIREEAALTCKSQMLGLNLLADDIIGLFLSPNDCDKLLSDGRIRQSLFPAAVRRRFDHLNFVDPHPGFFPIDRIPGLPPDGWRVAHYAKEMTLSLGEESGFPAPMALDIRPRDLRAREYDINRLLEIIDSPLFLHDLLAGDHVIRDQPPYLSEKLKYLIATSRAIWDMATQMDPKEYNKKREKVLDALNDREFHEYFYKKKATKGVIEAASKFIEPLFARCAKVGEDRDHVDGNDISEGNYVTPRYLSPELLILLAASKLYWSSSHVDLDNVATHPRNEDIEAYLRIQGISGNDADYAMTLIRPERAARGRPIPERSFFRPFIDRQIER